MSELEIALGDLQPDPHNVRGVYQRIEELAESIHQHGLLQNLVVKEEEDHFRVVAGNRRYYALKLLQSRGKWSRLVRCLLIDGKGDFEALAENAGQETVFIWRLGSKYLNYLEGGYTQTQLAALIGRTQAHVSIAVQIARGLSPAVVIRSERLGPGYISNNQLLRLAKLCDLETGEPLEKQQLEAFERILDDKNPRRPPKPKTKASEREMVWRRYQRLKKGPANHLPAHAVSYVRSLVRYLGGEDQRLRF